MVLEIAIQILMFFAVFLLVLWIPLRNDMEKFWKVAKVAMAINVVMVAVFILVVNFL